MTIRKKLRHDPSGFTLIELVTVIVIAGILGVVVFTGIGRSVETYMAVSDEAELSSEAWVAVERIGRELRHAANVSEPAPGGDSSTLAFTRPSAAASLCPYCVDNSTNISFSYTPADESLWRISDGTGTRLLADKVASFNVAASVDSIGKRTYTITITRRSNRFGGREVTVETAVRTYATVDNSWMEIIQ